MAMSSGQVSREKKLWVACTGSNHGICSAEEYGEDAVYLPPVVSPQYRHLSRRRSLRGKFVAGHDLFHLMRVLLP